MPTRARRSIGIRRDEMSQEEHKLSKMAGLPQKGFELLDRAWNANWALRLVCVVLFLDTAMMLRTDRGLWQWSPGDIALLSDVGWVALVIVIFSLAVALVIPAVLIPLRQIGVQLVYWFSSLAPAERFGQSRYQRPLGYVPVHALRDLALREKDEFLYRLYEEHVQSQDAANAFRRQVGELTAAAMLMSLLDWIVSLQVPARVGLIPAIYSAVGEWAPFIVAVVVFCAAAILKWAWFAPWEPELIYYPPLDRVLRDKERDARQYD